MASNKKAARELVIIRRYFIKKDYAPKGLHKGDVVIVVLNDEGKEREVILRHNGAHSCNCAAGTHNRKCYHLEYAKTVENNRRYQNRMAKIHAQEAAEIAQVVEAAKALESSKVVSMQKKRRMMNAPLTRNTSFKDAIAI